MTNKYLEKIAFPRLSEASFKNLTDDEKVQVHHYITNEADKSRKGLVTSRTVAGGAIGGLVGLKTGRKLGSGLVGTVIGAGVGRALGHHRADKVRDKKIDNTLSNANLASVLRQPVNGK